MIQIHRDGWPRPIASARCVVLPEHVSTEYGDVVWDSLRTPRLQLSRPACLLLLQGASLAQLIDTHAWISPAAMRGQLHLLRWKGDALWTGGSHLDNVVLAHVLEAPRALTTAALITLLLPRIMAI